MICYTVIDTNVLVSAMLTNHSDAATVQLICRMLAGDITPIYSDEIMTEYREVLGRKKFHFEISLVDYILSAIQKFGVLIEPSATGTVLPDMKDLPFYEVVMEKHDDGAFLVTGNLKHFPIKPYIVTARQMLEILESNKTAGQSD